MIKKEWLLLLFAFLFSLATKSAEVILNWKSDNAEGYILTYGTKDLVTVKDVEKTFSHKISIIDGTEYFFYVTPYSGLEKKLGPPSNIVKFNTIETIKKEKLDKPKLTLKKV